MTLGWVLRCFSRCLARASACRGSLRQEQALPSPARRGVETAALAALLGVICGLYVCYLVSQLAYFFSGFAGLLLPAGYTAAEYARRGFFEMAAISAIDLALTGAALQLARRQAGRLPGVLRGMLAFLSLFSLLLIATAASKLALYIASFGMTRLRVLTALFLLLLAVCFVLRAASAVFTPVFLWKASAGGDGAGHFAAELWQCRWCHCPV